jgi:hypothetical protein
LAVASGLAECAGKFDIAITPLWRTHIPLP